MRTDGKTYEFTGEMWSGFKVKETMPSEKKVILGGVTEMSQNKINWNTERDNDVIIDANQKELDNATQYIANELKKKINVALGSN